MTWDESINKTVLTMCPYFSRNLSKVCHDLSYTISASVSVSNITSVVCSQFNREGTHCGKCIPGYGPAPFLNGANVACAKCHKHNYLWVVVLLFQLSMVTLLYFTFVLCECRGTSSPINVMAYFYQITTNAIISNSFAYAEIMCALDNFAFLYVSLNLQAFWNLDFFRFSLPAVCVSPSMSNAQVLLFDYLVAFLPVIMTVLSYLFIELHDRDVKLVVWTWKPFHLLISRYKRDWNPKQSVLHAFATFLLLSYSKLLFTSTSLLYGAPVYDNDRIIVANSPVLYYDSTITYFSSRHAPYIFLSLTVIVTFVIFPPLILILYPTKCFRRVLEKTGFKRWHSLSIVMDVFQGWYKDGTTGTYDYRSLSALYMVLRVCFASEFILVMMFQYRTMYNSFEWTLPSLLHVALGSFFLSARPYKKSWMNIADGLVLVLMGISCVYIIVDDYAFGLGYVLTSLPILVSLAYITRKYILKTKMISCIKSSFRRVFVKHRVSDYHEATYDDDDDELLDQRLLQSNLQDVHQFERSMTLRVMCSYVRTTGVYYAHEKISSETV